MGYATILAFATRNARLIAVAAVVAVAAGAWAKHAFVKHQRDDAREELKAAEIELGNLCAAMIEGWGGDRGDESWPRYRTKDATSCHAALRLLRAERDQLMVSNSALNDTVDQLHGEIRSWAREYGLSQDRVSHFERSVRHLASELAAAVAREGKLSDLLDQTKESTDWADAPVRGPDVAERLRALARGAAGTGRTHRADQDHPSADARASAAGAGGSAGGIRPAAAGRPGHADQP